MHTTKCLQTVNFSEPITDAVLFKSSKEMAIAFGKSSKFSLLDMKKNGQLIKEYDVACSGIHGLGLAPNGNVFVSSRDGKALLFDVKSNLSISLVENNLPSLVNTFHLVDENGVFLGCEDGTVNLVDLRTFCLKDQLKKKHPSCISKIQKLDDSRFVSTCFDGTLSIFSKQGFSQVQHFHVDSGISTCAVVNSEKIITAGSEGKMELLMISPQNETIKHLHSFSGHFQPLHDMEMEANRILTCGEEIEWKLWKFTSHRHPAPLITFFT